MAQYLSTLPILFLTPICMLFLTVTNEYISSAHKKGFIAVFSGSFFITAFEVASIFLNGAPTELKFFHFLSNYLGFLLTPIFIIYFASSVGKFHRLKWAFISIVSYFVIYNILVITKKLFFIDDANTYHRGSMFCLYILTYALALLYLFFETLKYSQKGFLQHRVFAFLLSACFITSGSIQVFHPERYITRITVVFSLCMYYAYNLELTTLFDKLTSVLNQGTYLRKIKELKENQTVVILDIDNFKHINDTFGHQYGDKCLIDVSKTLKNVFGNHGQCYRIGGDEFAVLIKKHNNTEHLIQRFEKAIENKFKNASSPLTVSIGYSKFEKGDTYETVVQRTDSNMYDNKKQRKALQLTK